MNLVNPIPMNTDDPVSWRTNRSFSSFVPVALEKAMAMWAENYTARPTHVMMLTT